MVTFRLSLRCRLFALEVCRCSSVCAVLSRFHYFLISCCFVLPVSQSRRIPSMQPSAANQGPGCREWWGKYTRQTPTKNIFFPKHRASILNQHPRNTCKHQRNPSFVSMKPRVYKPQKCAAVGIQMAVGFLFLVF